VLQVLLLAEDLTCCQKINEAANQILQFAQDHGESSNLEKCTREDITQSPQFKSLGSILLAEDLTCCQKINEATNHILQFAQDQTHDEGKNPPPAQLKSLGGSLRPSCLLIESYIEEINKRLSDKGYKISCISDQKQYNDAGLYPTLNPDGKFEEDCHENTTCGEDNEINEFAIAMENIETGEFIAYITWSIEKQKTTGDKFILMRWSCTKKMFRRFGFSMVLRIIPFMYAMDHGISIVGSDVNEQSGSLLINKYGCSPLNNFEQFLKILNYEGTTYVDVSTNEFRTIYNARLKEIGDKYPKKG
jgi:hypothetical protein